MAVHTTLGKPTCQLAVLIAMGPPESLVCQTALGKGRVALDEV